MLLAYTLKMDAVRTYETLVNYRTKRRHISEDNIHYLNQWQAFVSTVMNIPVPQSDTILSGSCSIISS
jgi:hypothetical protein